MNLSSVFLQRTNSCIPAILTWSHWKAVEGKVLIRMGGTQTYVCICTEVTFYIFLSPTTLSMSAFQGERSSLFSASQRRCSINAFLTEPNSWSVSWNVILGSNGFIGTRESLTNLPNTFHSSKGKGLFESIDQSRERKYFYLWFCGW